MMNIFQSTWHRLAANEFQSLAAGEIQHFSASILPSGLVPAANSPVDPNDN